MKQVLQIPDEFQCIPFFESDVKKIEYDTDQSFVELLESTYFLFDIEKQYKPWSEIETSIPAVLDVWKAKKEDISILFRNRKRKEAKEPMIQFAAHLVSILHWLNGQLVPGMKEIEKEIEKLKIKPVNFRERYLFITAQPDHYHSFIQITQLYEEIEKLYVKALLIKKKSPSR
ncbi:GTPase [Bacillus sp. DX1.1]|uniref:YpoC family protein n=1 Tax=unclassified Bacillus (in: firmicutes) TaxID=185979 RepID=UPI0025710E61|nr:MULTISPECIES: GTPase [unclassified Bacillus (in: firmicutes)]MDM5154171.1 GTPase [Bacillus sp. DX1.1]WJE83092.1 GTPase [Bacillus sp. DX3.1]